MRALAFRLALSVTVVTHLGNGTTEAQAESVVENLSQAGHVVDDSKGALTYWLE